MKSLLVILSLISIACCLGPAQYLDVPLGKENVELKLASANVKTITRKLEGSEEVQTWNVEKKTWQDLKGKPIPSANFSYKAPGTIIIEKVNKADAGYYDYEMKSEVTEAQKNLPEGVFVDVEPMLTGIELKVLQ